MRGEQYLTKPSQYAQVHGKGKSWVDNLLVMRILPNSLDISRYGFSVSRRVGNAVARNKAKRRLREILRQTVLRSGYDIVFIVRPPASHASYVNLKQSVRNLLSRANILVEEYEEARPGTD